MGIVLENYRSEVEMNRNWWPSAVVVVLGRVDSCFELIAMQRDAEQTKNRGDARIDNTLYFKQYEIIEAKQIKRERVLFCLF